MKPLVLLLCCLLGSVSAQELRDIEYATKLKLDAHVPEGEGPFPIVILVHGGGNKGDRQSYVGPLFAPLSAASFTWFTIDYRPAKHGFAASVADVTDAVRWVKANAARYKGDPKRIALLGESAGGILALLAAGRGAGVQSVVALYTPADLSYIVRGGNVPPIVRHYWGIGDDENLTRWQREWSPITYAARMPPVLLIHGTADTKVPFDNSVRLERALKEAGVPAELIPVEKGDHGMSSWQDASWQEKMIAWLRAR
jgi:acetyl esterase